MFSRLQLGIVASLLLVGILIYLKKGAGPEQAPAFVVVEPQARPNEIAAKPILISDDQSLNKVSNLDSQEKQNLEVKVAEASDNALEQMRILKEILASHNDNDARLDLELKSLNSDAKKLFQKHYEDLPVERRSDRGTIIFLLGRNMSEQSDFEFLQKVLLEKPCKSLMNCAQADVNTSEDDTQSEVALQYPQAVVLESVDRYISSHSEISPELKKEFLSLLEKGAHSKSPLISSQSKGLLKRL